ncbi:MAG: hypothetical protein GF334_08230 [Candidatus Altiarchaeales archaeon]|nr:hypothetical protein [Candidatus Altiarchaeales archaeon]
MMSNKIKDLINRIPDDELREALLAELERANKVSPIEERLEAIEEKLDELIEERKSRRKPVNIPIHGPAVVDEEVRRTIQRIRDRDRMDSENFGE